MCDFDEPSVDLGRKWRKARKAHVCFACHEPISPGHYYHHSVMIFDGGIDVYKHCARCWMMIEALWAETGEAVEFGLDCGETWEDPPDDVAALAFMTPEEAQQHALLLPLR